MLPLYSIHCCRSSDISAWGQSGLQDTHLVRDKAGVRTEQLFNHTEETNPAFCNFLCVAGGRRQEEHQEKGLGHVSGAQITGDNKKVHCAHQLWGW